MRKVFEIIVSITLVFSLTTCGGQVEISEKDESNSQSPSSGAEANQTGTSDEKQKPDNESPIHSIKIDGEEYTFPMSYEAFKSYGWTYHVPEEDDVSQWPTTVKPNTTFDMDFDKDEIKWLEFLFYNNTTDEVTLE